MVDFRCRWRWHRWKGVEQTGGFAVYSGPTIWRRCTRCGRCEKVKTAYGYSGRVEWPTEISQAEFDAIMAQARRGAIHDEGCPHKHT